MAASVNERDLRGKASCSEFVANDEECKSARLARICCTNVYGRLIIL
jgi:hypothetical protein